MQIGEVADQHETRHFLILETGKILGGLHVSFVQILVAGFHFHQQLARQEGIDSSGAASEFLYPRLKINQAMIGNIEYPAQAIDKFLVKA